MAGWFEPREQTTSDLMDLLAAREFGDEPADAVGAWDDEPDVEDDDG